MRTREPILTRGRDYWDKVNMPVEAFHERMDRVRDAMAREGVDVLLLYGTGDRDGDIAYVSNLVHKVPGFPLALVVTQDTAVVLNQRSSRTRPIVERSTWVEDVRFTRDLWSDLDGVLADVADSEDEIGFVGADALSYTANEDLETLASTWSIEVKDGFLDGVRAVKDRRERDQIRRSGRVLRAIDELLAEALEPPTSERELEAELDRTARLHGAQDFRFMISNPAHTEGAHRPAEDVPIEAGDPVSIYLASRFEGYWASIARTMAFGDASGSLPDLAPVEGILDELIESLGAHRDAGSAVEGAKSAVEELGLEIDGRYDVLSGIGLELDEPPVLPTSDPDVETHLEPGMCFEVTLPVAGGTPDSMLVGETVVVTESGAKPVTRRAER